MHTNKSVYRHSSVSKTYIRDEIKDVGFYPSASFFLLPLSLPLLSYYNVTNPRHIRIDSKLKNNDNNNGEETKGKNKQKKKTVVEKAMATSQQLPKRSKKITSWPFFHYPRPPSSFPTELSTCFLQPFLKHSFQKKSNKIILTVFCEQINKGIKKQMKCINKWIYIYIYVYLFIYLFIYIHRLKLFVFFLSIKNLGVHHHSSFLLYFSI